MELHRIIRESVNEILITDTENLKNQWSISLIQWFDLYGDNKKPVEEFFLMNNPIELVKITQEIGIRVSVVHYMKSHGFKCDHFGFLWNLVVGKVCQCAERNVILQWSGLPDTEQLLKIYENLILPLGGQDKKVINGYKNLKQLMHLESINEDVMYQILSEYKQDGRRCFISHAGSSKDLLIGLLSNKRAEVFLDKWEESMKLSTQEFISSGVRGCNRFIFVLDAEFFQRKWCILELKIGQILSHMGKVKVSYVTFGDVDDILRRIQVCKLRPPQIKKIEYSQLIKMI